VDDRVGGMPVYMHALDFLSSPNLSRKVSYPKFRLIEIRFDLRPLHLLDRIPGGSPGMLHRQRLARGPDRIGWQHKARVTEMLADLSPLVRTLDAY
jgi:hypothetical protein